MVSCRNKLSLVVNRKFFAKENCASLKPSIIDALMFLNKNKL